MHDLHRAVVEPRWDGALVAFHAEVARRMPMLAVGGHEELFAALHPRLRWRDNGLDRTGFDGEYDLHGLGLVLMPSPFWTGDPLFSISADGLRPNVLVYAAHLPAAALGGREPPARDGLTADPVGGDSLAALLGPTRAAVLRALAAPRGTSELAGVVGISPASASEHAKVLRDVYLIETSREGRAARHSLTPLGRTMLGQLPGPGPAAGRGLAEVHRHLLDADVAEQLGEHRPGALLAGGEQRPVMQGGGVDLVFRGGVERAIAVRVVPETLRCAVDDPVGAGDGADGRV